METAVEGAIGAQALTRLGDPDNRRGFCPPKLSGEYYVASPKTLLSPVTGLKRTTLALETS